MPNCPVRNAPPFPWCVAVGTGYLVAGIPLICYMMPPSGCRLFSCWVRLPRFYSLAPVIAEADRCEGSKNTHCVSYPTSLEPGRRHSRIATGIRCAPESPMNPVFHPTLLIVKERAAGAGEKEDTMCTLFIQYLMYLKWADKYYVYVFRWYLFFSSYRLKKDRNREIMIFEGGKIVGAIDR